MLLHKKNWRSSEYFSQYLPASITHQCHASSSLTKPFLHHSDIDTSYFVLTVDLWSQDASKEVNLVRHSATSPSISATTASSYPPNTDNHDTIAPAPPSAPQYIPTPLQQMQISTAYSQSMQPPTSAAMFPQMPTPYLQHQYPQQQIPQAYGPPPISTQQSQQPGYWMNTTSTPMTPTGHMGQGPLLSPSALSNQSCDPRSNPSGMFTRNLIGSLCVSAFKLTDHENNLGVWFILQDLSVRTEGSFR